MIVTKTETMMIGGRLARRSSSPVLGDSPTREPARCWQYLAIVEADTMGIMDIELIEMIKMIRRGPTPRRRKVEAARQPDHAAASAGVPSRNALESKQTKIETRAATVPAAGKKDHQYVAKEGLHEDQGHRTPMMDGAACARRTKRPRD